MNSTRHQFTVLKQICDLVPPHLVSRLAVEEHGVEEKLVRLRPGFIRCH